MATNKRDSAIVLVFLSVSLVLPGLYYQLEYQPIERQVSAQRQVNVERTLKHQTLRNEMTRLQSLGSEVFANSLDAQVQVMLNMESHADEREQEMDAGWEAFNKNLNEQKESATRRFEILLWSCLVVLSMSLAWSLLIWWDHSTKTYLLIAAGIGIFVGFGVANVWGYLLFPGANFESQFVAPFVLAGTNLLAFPLVQKIHLRIAPAKHQDKTHK